MTAVASDSVKRSRWWWVILVGVMVVVAWFAIFCWQYERQRADTAVLHAADSVRVSDTVLRQIRAVQTQLDDATHLVDVALLYANQDTDLGALGAAIGRLHDDVQAEVALYSDIDDALARRDFTTYNNLLHRFDVIGPSWDTDLADVNRLHHQLGLSACTECENPTQ